MQYLFRRFFHMSNLLSWAFAAVLLSAGLALAQSEPGINEIYATAQAGKLDEAQKMITHVLISHPNSARAHFVQSELYARQGDLAKAREALSAAERLAPGLPFVKPEAAQALRFRLSQSPSTLPRQEVVGQPYSVAARPAGSWTLPLLLGGAAIFGGYLLFRRKMPTQFAPPPPQGYGSPSSPSGGQTFGSAGGGGMPSAPPQGPGLGRQIAGGVATGLAVGAGVMAAEALGRNLMSGHNQPLPPQDRGPGESFQAGDTHADMGGQDFGIGDAGSWDDGDVGSLDDGSDWNT